MAVRIGTAGWTLPRAHAYAFPDAGTHLSRYASVMTCAEVNSTFYRAHARRIWERWIAATPSGFLFSVKAPKTITHEAKLVDTEGALAAFFEQIAVLGDKLGPVLFQLPPKLAFHEKTARNFFTSLRSMHAAPVALEPRHESWFTAEVEGLLTEFQIARVAADPPKGGLAASSPGGFAGLRYYRLHGSPRIYWSAYEEDVLGKLAKEIQNEQGTETWVIFDNTASGAALGNAMQLRAMV